MRTWEPTNPPIDWKVILHTWGVYHLIRTLAAVGSFIVFIVATHSAAGKPSR
ncbi:hypothetical protein [Paraflavitalea speifideaquila]|uniref:hypothetical protein n=1 Tax=Paraflavitalea speifideaquila TaxID=3076558 RepID=UPI0028EBCE0C|nr:hypothetical protein [Paraflavitalea speifideiaquila]